MDGAIADTGEDRVDGRDPVLNLPPELVSATFRLLDFWDRIAVSHVTSSWRALALADTLLWSELDLTPPIVAPLPLRPAAFSVSGDGEVHASLSPPHSFVFRPPSPDSAPQRANMLRELLQRSYPLPVTLTWPSSHISGAPPDVVAVIAQNMFRMQALSLPLEVSDFQTLLEAHAPLLKCFHYAKYNPSYDLPARWDAPRLETLELPCVRIPADMQPLHSVTSFSCEALLDPGRTGIQLFSIFPSLRSLKVDVLMKDTLPALSNPPASLARIELGTSYRMTVDYGPLLRACAGYQVRTLYAGSAASCADALELFTSVVPGTWRMKLADAGGSKIQLTATDDDAVYTIACAGTVSLTREPRIAMQLARLASLTAPAQLLVDLEALFSGWSRSLPALRDLTIHFGNRDQMDAALPPARRRVRIRAPLLEAVVFSITAETEGCGPWVTDVFPGFLRSRFSLVRPRLASIVLRTAQQRVPEVAELAALRALTECLRVDLRSHRRVLEYRDEAV